MNTRFTRNEKETQNTELTIYYRNLLLSLFSII